MPAESDASLAKFSQILTEELRKCSKCGSCASVCPVYAEKLSEAYCSRGKMLLARDVVRHGGETTARLAEIFNNCLVCLACRENCPGGVRMDKVVLAARALLAEKGMQPKAKRLVFEKMLAAPATMRPAMKLGSMVQSLLFQKIPESSGLRRRFPFPALAEDQPVPDVASVPFRQRVPEYIAAPAGSRKGDVIYFVGCAANYLFPTIGEAVVHVLHRLGYGVIIPSRQGCCGTPVEVGGETDILRELMRANLEALGGGSEPIVTACGSGGLMLTHGYPDTAQGEERRKAESIAARTCDISVFLVKQCGMPSVLEALTRRCVTQVTYHESCHLGRGLGVHSQPRELLHAIAPNYVEMKQADRCCGSGGTYGLTHWEVARGILARKIANIRGSGAAVVATGCPACLLQVEGGLGNAHMAGNALHTIELLAWCMGYEPASARERTRFMRLR